MLNRKIILNSCLFILTVLFLFNVNVLFSQNCTQIYSGVTYSPLTVPNCVGESKTYYAYSSIGTPGIIFSWKDHNGIVLSNIYSYLATQSGADTLFLVANYTGCPTFYDTLVFYIKINPELSLNLGPNQSFCEGGSTTINAAVADATNYLWSTGATSSSITVSTSGNYNVSVTNECGQGRDTVNINVMPKPNVNLGGNRVVCYGTPLTLDAGIANATYLWTTGANSQTISVIERNITVGVKVDSSGCIGGDTITISDCPVEAQLPNAFSPNGDGKNDVLYVRGNNISEVDLRIYNRLGNLVFHGATPQEGWDGKILGKLQESDVYVYILRAKMSDGTVYEKSGNVMLVK